MMRALAPFLLLLLVSCGQESPSGSSQERTATGLLPGQNTQGLVVLDARADRPFYWDFDRVPFGERPAHTFRLKNTDSKPVTILDLQANCGCTQPRITMEVQGETIVGRSRCPILTIPPGAVAQLEIAVDTRLVEKMNIDKLGVVRLRCDSENAPFLAFEVHLIVERLFRSVPGEVNLGEIPRTSGKDRRADLSTELARSPARLIRIEGIDGPFRATLDATQVGEEPLWILLVSALPDLPLGPVRGKIRLVTTDHSGVGESGRFEVPIRGDVVEPILLRPALLVVSSGSGASARIECLPAGMRVSYISSFLEGEGADTVALSVTPESPDVEGRASAFVVEVRPRQGLPTQQLALRARIRLSESGFEDLQLPISIQSR
jgi:hypothetical protein